MLSFTHLAAFVWTAGFVVGLGAVSVIETLGFLGQRSPYWTETTIRAHKVTKPLIWIGLSLATLGGAWYYSLHDWPTVWLRHGLLLVLMIANGSFLTFWISPRLLERERQGRATQLLPKSWKTAVTLSFLVSITTWWSALWFMISVIVD
jgi:hypothetical protein